MDSDLNRRYRSGLLCPVSLLQTLLVLVSVSRSGVVLLRSDLMASLQVDLILQPEKIKNSALSRRKDPE